MNSKLLNKLLTIAISICLFTCSSNEIASRIHPSIDTNEVTDINSSGATFNAEMLGLGNGVKDYGFVYGLANPSVDNSDRISLGETLKKGKFSALANRNLIKDSRYYVRAYAIPKATGPVVYGQLIQFVSQGATPPAITSFTPKEGSVGDTLIVIGAGFSNQILSNSIFLGTPKTLVPVFKSTQDSLWSIIQGTVIAGDNEVSVTVGQLSTVAKEKFKVKVMSITSFYPREVSFSDTVTIEGENFPIAKGFLTGLILGVSPEIISTTRTKVKAKVSNSVTLLTSTVVLKSGTQTSASSSIISLLPPVIESFLPSKGSRDTEVAIAGKYFNPIAASNKVKLNGKDVTVMEATRKTLKVKIPTGIPPGNYSFSVTILNQAITSIPTFEIIKPIITNVAPLTGTFGDMITITGNNFGATAGTNIVKFGAAVAAVVNSTPTELKVKVPAELITKNSMITVQVSTADDLIATFTMPFVLNAPQISNFNPNSGKANTSVVITGSNFSSVVANNVVDIGGQPMQVISASPTQLKVNLPKGLLDGDFPINVTVAEQSVASIQLFHLTAPWKRLADFPPLGRDNATAFTIGNFGYLGAGNELGTPIFERTQKKFWKYNPSSDVWTPIHYFAFTSSGTTEPFVNMVSMSNDNNAFVGLGGSGLTPNVQKYDPVSDTWPKSTDYPAAEVGIDAGVCYSINGKGYVATGREINNRVSFKMWEFDMTSETWTRKADLPATALRWEASGFAIGTKAYLIGGAPCYGCTNFLQDVWEYDIVSNTWRQKSNFPGQKRFRATAFSINGIGYLVSGENKDGSNSILMNDVWRYDPASDIWTQLGDFPGPKRSGAAVFVIGNKAYFGTGLSPTQYVNDFYEFDPLKL